MPITHADFEYIRHLVSDRTALVLSKDKTYLVESRLTSLTRILGISSIQSLVKQLRSKDFGNLHQQVIEAMVTTETSFFRDHHPFEVMRQSILPELIETCKIDHKLNIFCAACSTGQEPYSVALLLQEYFPELKSWTLNLTANDISGKVLDRARKGEYTQHEVERGLPDHLRQKYFKPHGKLWKLSPSICQMIDFHQFNLAQAWPLLPKMDIIFLRNVLIYFDVSTKQSILAKVNQLLKPEGYLFLGGGETTLTLDYAFEPVQFEKFVCYRLRPESIHSREEIKYSVIK